MKSKVKISLMSRDGGWLLVRKHVPTLRADREPGETREIRGILWFYSGPDVNAFIDRIEATSWHRGLRNP